MTVANTVGYNDTKTITVVKRCVVQSLGLFSISLIKTVIDIKL
jgi:hypothetical protein